MIELIDLKAIRRDGSDLPDLRALLLQLIGQPFQFFRAAYGEELRLHLGDLQGYSSPRMRGRTRGSYIVGARASSSIVSSAPRQMLAASDVVRVDSPGTPGSQRVGIDAVETGGFVAPGSIVTDAGADRSDRGFSLHLRFSDGSMIHIRPNPGPSESMPEIEMAPDDVDRRGVSDWEILTPHQRILRAGPGPRWDYADATTKPSHQT